MNTYTQRDRENMNITTFEATALKDILKGYRDLSIENDFYDGFDEGFCDSDAHTISKACSIEVNQAKGVIGSLVKKGLIYQHDADYDFMINLTSLGYEEVKKTY